MLPYLIVGGLLAAPSSADFFYGQTQVGAAELIQHLFRLVEQTAAESPFDLQNSLQKPHRTKFTSLNNNNNKSATESQVDIEFHGKCSH